MSNQFQWFKSFNNKLNWELNSSSFLLLISFANLIIYQIPLYKFAYNNINMHSMTGILTILVVSIVIFSLSYFIFLFITLISANLTKIVTIILALINSVALYFVITYNVILTKAMMGNIFNTQTREAFSFISPELFLYFFIFGIIPAYLLYKIKIIKNNRGYLIIQAIVVFIVSVLFIYINSSSWLWIDKNAKRLGGMIMPWSYLINTARQRAKPTVKDQILLPPAIFSDNEKMLVVLVIGESARAQNFSLYGYKQNTNPLLKSLNAIALKNTTSCATYTTAAVHCLLSYQGDSSDKYEPLPNYLQRHGVDVTWRTKNWGEPALKVKTYQKDGELAKNCKGTGCKLDEVLLTGLKEQILSSKKKKQFIVLHTYGSHGPAYYKKYPKTFDHFQPSCKSIALDKCSNQELINAYDNTILYTDYFLSKTINILKSFKDTPTLLIYISDHGESLGEYNLYLHGTPFSLAPDFQKKVPFIIWMSESFKEKKSISEEKLKQQKTHSPKNIFHSIMGAFGMNSDIYDARFDIFN